MNEPIYQPFPPEKPVQIPKTKRKYKSFKVFIIFMVILIFGTLSGLGSLYLYEKYQGGNTDEKLQEVTERAYLYGVTQTLDKTIKIVRACEILTIESEGKAYKLLWIECLKGGNK